MSGHGERTAADGLSAVGIKRKKLNRLGGGGGKEEARSEGAGKEETFLIGQRLAQLHLLERRWSPFLPSPCHFQQELPSPQPLRAISTPVNTQGIQINK